MSLFKFESGEVKVEKDLALLSTFQKVLEKEQSDKYIAYIYHMVDWDSPYATQSQEQRKQNLIDELFDGQEIEDEDVDKALELYKKLTTTDSLALLDSARKAVKELQSYFSEMTMKDEEDKGKAAKDLMQNLKSVGAIIKSLKEWEEQIKQEKDARIIRRGVEIDKYNS